MSYVTVDTGGNVSFITRYIFDKKKSGRGLIYLKSIMWQGVGSSFMDRETLVFAEFMAVWQTQEYNPFHGPHASAALKTLLLVKKIFNNPTSRVSS